jgi:hypothetical protein
MRGRRIDALDSSARYLLRHSRLDIAAGLGQNRRFDFDPKLNSGELIE